MLDLTRKSIFTKEMLDLIGKSIPRKVVGSFSPLQRNIVLVPLCKKIWAMRLEDMGPDVYVRTNGGMPCVAK